MAEGHLDVGGAVAFWSLADGTDRDRLRAGLTPLGLESFVPDPRPPSACLRDALEEELGGPRTLVRPLAARDGFAVVREDRGQHQNAYATVLVAKVIPGDPPELSFDPVDPNVDRVIASYRKHLGRIPAVQLSAALVKVVDHLGGVRLRPTGAVYWVPGHKLDAWASVARAVEAASNGKPSSVYLLRHRLDGDAVRAVRDAVVAEVTTEAGAVLTEVSTGELGGKALEARQRQAADLRRKVSLYEHLLSVGLDSLHQAVDQADQAAAAAALLLSAQARPTHAAAAATAG